MCVCVREGGGEGERECEDRCLQRAEENIRFSGATVTGHCEPNGVGAGNCT